MPASLVISTNLTAGSVSALTAAGRTGATAAGSTGLAARGAATGGQGETSANQVFHAIGEANEAHLRFSRADAMPVAAALVGCTVDCAVAGAAIGCDIPAHPGDAANGSRSTRSCGWRPGLSAVPGRTARPSAVSSGLSLSCSRLWATSKCACQRSLSLRVSLGLPGAAQESRPRRAAAPIATGNAVFRRP